MSRPPRPLRTARALIGAAALIGLGSAQSPATAAPARERAIEQIPELMGRILESQEKILEQESEMVPVVEEFDEQLTVAKQEIDAAGSEVEASEALVEYVEAYAARLNVQEEGLKTIEPSIVRMRADARDLLRAAEEAGKEPELPEERESFAQEQFEGVAGATRELAVRLGREDDAAIAGAVLHASWASRGAIGVQLEQFGPEGAAVFARKVEGLYARYHARANQVRAERRAVQRLLDLLIQRQLARQLDDLFDESDVMGLGPLLALDGKSANWQDLGQVVSRALGLPDGSDSFGTTSTPSLERLDFFAGGGHRE